MSIGLPIAGKQPPAGGRNQASSSYREINDKMPRNITWLVTALLLLPVPARAAGLCEAGLREEGQAPQQRGGHSKSGARPDQPGERTERPKWWIDAKLRAELGITDQQSTAVELVWQKSLPALREGRQQLETLEETLSKMTDVSDEAAVKAQIDRVENLRADLSKARTLMIYRMHKILTADQRAKVKAMHERDRREPSRRGSSLR